MEPLYVFLQGTTYIMELHYLSQWRQSLLNRWLERDLNVQLLAKLVETALISEEP